MTAGRIDGAALEREVMAGLKSFQQKTVEYVYRRMFTDPEPVERFLASRGGCALALGELAPQRQHFVET